MRWWVSIWRWSFLRASRFKMTICCSQTVDFVAISFLSPRRSRSQLRPTYRRFGRDLETGERERADADVRQGAPLTVPLG